MATFLALLAILLAAGIHVERERAGPERRELSTPRWCYPRETRRHPPLWLSTAAEFPFPPRDGQWGDSAGKIWPPSSCRMASAREAPARASKECEVTPSGWQHAPARRLAGVAPIGWSNGGSALLTTAQVAPDMPPGS